MSALPMEGIRICDLTTYWSGPFCTLFLGGMGAEVIKVESIQRPDGFRFGTEVFDKWWEAYPLWNSVNLNKYGVTMNLDDPRGKEIFKKLVKISDIVIENYSPRVMDAFDLSYRVIREVKPDIIMMSMPSYGMSGPWRDYVGWATTFEQAAGITYLTGYTDGHPWPPGGFADPYVGAHVVFAVLAALEYRRRTGKGQYIDMSQTECLAGMLGAAVIDYSLNKRVWGRLGNRDPIMAPHGVYRCQGEDSWVAIAISSDNDWVAFCQAIGKAELAQDERFSTLSERYRNQDELNRLIEEWTIKHEDYQAMNILEKVGVAAGAVTSPEKGHHEPHFKETGFFEELTRDVIGTQLFPRWPVRFSETPPRNRPAPLLGQHNDYVLRELLGLSRDEMKRLADDKVIGTEPPSGVRGMR